jgi:DHA1 family bicyclomycin/chloramphenicol resistance-like MFS transporter
LAAFAFMTLFYGTLSDALGRRPVILAALIVFALASIGASLTNNFALLLVFRGLQGASAGAGRVIGQAIVRDKFDGAHAQRMISQIAMVFGIAPIIAPMAGGFLHVHYGWRANFALMTAIGVMLFVASWRALPETLPVEKRQPFRLDSIARNYATALRQPRFLLCVLAIGFSFGGFAVYISSAPAFVMEILHLPETAFAWLFIPMISGTIVGSFIVTRIARRIRPSTLIRIGFALMILAALFNVVYNSLFAAAIPWAVMPIMLYSFGLALAIPGMTVAALDFFPTMRGLASSLQGFAQMTIFASISGFIAPLLYTSALKLAWGVAACVLLCMVCWGLGSRGTPAPKAGSSS